MMNTVTWSPSDKHPSVILSNGNLNVSAIRFDRGYRPTKLINSGKYYLEFVQLTGTHPQLMLYNHNATLTSNVTQNSVAKWDLYAVAGYSIGQTIGMAIDLDNGIVDYYLNGVFKSKFTGIPVGGYYSPIFTEASGADHSMSTNFGATPFQYPIPEGFIAYNTEPIIVKHLIKSSNKIQVLINGEWLDSNVSEPLSQEVFEIHGMNSLAHITQEQWDELDEEFEILTWTSETDENLSKFVEIETQPFKPIDILNKAESFEVLTWTDESSSVELQVNGSLQAIDSGKLFSFELDDFDTIANIEII